MARLCLNIFLVVAGQKWVKCSIPDSETVAVYLLSVYLKRGDYRSLDSSYTSLIILITHQTHLCRTSWRPTSASPRETHWPSYPWPSWTPGREYLIPTSGQTSYLEIYAAVTVLVKYPEYLVHEDLCVASRKYHGVHLQDFIFAKLTVRAVLFESSGKW